MFKILLFTLFGLPLLGLSQQWRDLDGGVDGAVHAMYVDSINNELYVGGTFQHAGGLFTSCIAKWDSVQWSDVGSDTIKGFADVRCIAKFNGDIIAGGFFDSIGMVRMNNISRWDGSRWNPMGFGFSGAVLALKEYKGELYAGGSFEFSGNDTIIRIAKWDGFNWMNLPGFIRLDDDVETLIQYDSLLVIGGDFQSASSIPNSSRIIAFDGVNWISLNSFFNSFIFALEVFQDTLYAGGRFTSAPGAPSNYMSKFDGLNWQPMPYPSGGTNWITDMSVFQNSLVVVGYFNDPEDIGVFNGISYDSIGGAMGSVFRSEVFKNELYVAGGFTQIGNINTLSVARYSDFISNLNSSFDFVDSIRIYPNPVTNNYFQLDYGNSLNEQLIVLASNVFGQKLNLNIIDNKYYFTDASNGIYFIQVYIQDRLLKKAPIILIKP